MFCKFCRSLLIEWARDVFNAYVSSIIAISWPVLFDFGIILYMVLEILLLLQLKHSHKTNGKPQ